MEDKKYRFLYRMYLPLNKEYKEDRKKEKHLYHLVMEDKVRYFQQIL